MGGEGVVSRGRSLVLDRQYKSIGRIKRATGTSDPKLYKMLDSMLDTLYQAGRVDILQAIQQGRLHPMVVWSRYRLGDLAHLPTAESMRPLAEAMEKWVDESDTGHWNRASRRYGVRALLRRAGAGATLEGLPDLLRDYAGHGAGATMFNRTRSAVQAFLRDTLGKSHPLYARVRDVQSKRIASRREGNPQSPAQLTEIAQKLHPAHAEILWNMAVTGMGPGELWGSWTQYPTHIHVRGTKRAGRVRDIPRVRPIARPTRKYRAFLVALEQATKETVRPYDLRRTFAHSMELAGIPRTRRELYMGHRARDVLDLYERHDVERFLVEDGDKLRAYLGDLPLAGIRLA
jgi:integrase